MQIFDGQVRFGIHSGPQNTTFADYLAMWQEVEALGFDWASVFDHFMPIQADPTGPCFEGLTMLAALAAHTKRLRCGILVVGNGYRNPAVLAKMASTIDHISGGRLELGIGGGWFELEHDAYGIPFPSAATRIRMAGEAAKILKRLWTEPAVTFEGEHYHLKDAFCAPKPLQSPLPLWYGGAGEKLSLRVVAESADGWNTFLTTPEEYRHKLDVLAEHCAAVGRDPHDIRKSLCFVAVLSDDEAEARARVERLTKEAGAIPEMMRQHMIVGTPATCVERLRPFLEAGVGDFLLLARAPFDFETIRHVAREVAPAIKAAPSR